DGGDGGPAADAYLSAPLGITVDETGNLYFAEVDRVRKVNGAGMISTVAGKGIYGGDGGPATAASFFQLQGVVVDAVGNLYVADQNNQRIRKVDTAGIISTAAGNGDFGYSGDGGLATAASLSGPEGIAVDTAGNLYFSEFSNPRIRKVNTAGIISTVAG